MTETIFEEVKADLAREGRDLASEGRRVAHSLASHLPHREYHAGSAALSVPEGPAMSILTEAVSKIDEGVANVESWIGELKPHIATAAAEVQRIEGSPAAQALVKAAEDAGLPDAWVSLAVDFIGKLGQMAASTAAPATPAGSDASAAEAADGTPAGSQPADAPAA